MKTIYNLILLLLLCYSGSKGIAQNVYEKSILNEKNQTETHRLFVNENYVVETIFGADPAQFIQTKGGHYKKKGTKLTVDLEFNSNYTIDNRRKAKFKLDDSWTKVDMPDQDLDGIWQMGGRMNDIGISRRDTSLSRKTLKILFKGYFQWIAFDTESMKFSGTGGGTFDATAAQYTEKIDYFSRDNSRVGASLPFDYELIEGDWHHKGLSSKGKAFHEIWVRRF